MNTQDVQFWSIRKRAGRKKPWEVRWRIDTRSFSRSRLTKALAETYRGKLMAAARGGEVFSLATGEPISWEVAAETFYAHARAYTKLLWAEWAPNTRKSIGESLCAVTLAFLDPRKNARNRPDDKLLRKALKSWALNPPTWDHQPPAEIASALAWLADASRPVADLAEPATLREVLSDISTLLNGKPASHSTIRRRRAAWYGCLDYAVERKLLNANPLSGLRIRRRRTTEAVDPRKVPNLTQARRLLDAIRKLGERGAHLFAFFAVLYYAGTRPAEARNIREADCVLPETGWGTITLCETLPDVGAEWTDNGDRYEHRELKHRAPGDIRPVPIPPVLVAIIRAHIHSYGTAPDGRLFFDGPEHAPITGSMYRGIWTRARTAALNDTETAQGLAPRPYDLRHGNASLLLNSDVPATEVARRLGHSVAMLYSTYAHWFQGLETIANARIDAALSNTAPSETPGHGPTTGHDTEQPAA